MNVHARTRAYMGMGMDMDVCMYVCFHASIHTLYCTKINNNCNCCTYAHSTYTLLCPSDKHELYETPFWATKNRQAPLIFQKMPLDFNKKSLTRIARYWNWIRLTANTQFASHTQKQNRAETNASLQAKEIRKNVFGESSCNNAINRNNENNENNG